MNNINEIKDIIFSLGGAATAEEIVHEYCVIHHMIVQPFFKNVVEHTLIHNVLSVRKNKTSLKWELVIEEPRPYLVICRVAYMKYYDGITEDDKPVNGGSYVTENNDAAEKYNFHCYEDGNCYIFVETKYKPGHTAEEGFAKSIAIEQIDSSYKNKESIENVRVVLMAFSPILNKNVVVGWYDNVTVYRNRIIEPDKTYMMKCSYADAHLIPEAERSFEVPRARGNEYGIGQSNFWYIQKVTAARDYEDKLVKYISNRSKQDGIVVPPLPVDDGSLKVGDYIYKAMRNLSDAGYCFSEEAINKMTTSEWSLDTFHTQYPFMKIYVAGETDLKWTDGYQRFKDGPYPFGDYQVLITKEWKDHQLKYFKDWYKTL